MVSGATPRAAHEFRPIRNGGASVNPRTFDALVQRLSRTLSRRSLVGGSLGAATLGAVEIDEAATAKTRNKQRRGGVTAEHCLAIGQRCDPKREIREGKRHKKKTHTCEGIEKRDKKSGQNKIVRGCCTRYSVPDGNIRRCACVPNGEPCTAETARNCCSQVCTGGVCGSGPTCPEEGQTCATAPGTACCPNVDPDIVCAGGFTENKICQDCTRPPTAAGAVCQTPNGNQCCGGRPRCFVGVRVDTGQPDCFATGSCDTELGQPPCTQNFTASCSSGQTCCPASEPICAQATSGCGCTATFCGAPCGTP
jgi:hypothetical protein